LSRVTHFNPVPPPPPPRAAGAAALPKDPPSGPSLEDARAKGQESLIRMVHTYSLFARNDKR